MSSAPIIVHSILPPPASESTADATECWSPVSLWMPHRIVESGWHQHAPFAFWLTQAARPRSFVELGVHGGFSYLSFCQAVHELGLNTTCYGVDTWEGDEHAGFYGPEVLGRLRQYHDSHYNGFSQLIQSTFADAIAYFEEQSIDLLHIDGRHFYEDVRDDFEAWLPKLSERAVVLLHDTNVREKEFGVWRLWQELASDYPSFEFKHGHGLGVLAVGKDVAESLRPLFFGSEDSREKVRQFYARLGSTVAERAELGLAREAIAVRDSELGLLRGEVKARADAFLALESEIDRLRSKVEADQVSLASEHNALRAELGAKTAEILSVQGQLDSRDKLASALRAEVADKSVEISKLRSQCDALAERMRLIDEEFARKVDELATLKAHIEQSEARFAAAKENAAREVQALSGTQAELARKQDHIDLIEAELETRDRRIAVLEAEFARKVDQEAKLYAELRTNEERVNALLKKHNIAKARAMAVSHGQVRSRDQQIAMLRLELRARGEQTRKEIVEAESRLLDEKAAFDEALERSAAAIHARDNTIAALRNELAEQYLETQQLAHEIIELRADIANWQHLTRTREQQLANTRVGLAALESSTSWKLTSPLRNVKLGALAVTRSVAGLAKRIYRRPVSTDLATSVERPHPASIESPAVIDCKEQARNAKRERLKRFMESSNRIALRESTSPLVSVVLVTYNSPELVYGCLSALAQNLSVPSQIIIFDNASGQETVDLLHRVDGAAITLHGKNIHFLRGVNLAALPARGRYLLILNSDAEIAPGAVEAAIETLERTPNAGAVGGRIILPDGTLQEAGCVIWKDGSCAGYGRGGDPEAREFNWRRSVDFCSGVFLVIPRETFTSLGGFEEAFAPAYYEEVDLAVRLREIGKRIIYDPRAVVFHHEYGSSDSSRATDLMRRNQTLFHERHAEFLTGQHAPDSANLLAARSTTARAKRILYIEDDVPVGTAGSGMPRTREIVRELTRLGFEITFVALQNWARAMRGVYEFLPLDVELADLTNRSLEEFLASRQGYFARIFVSRPHNMAALAEVRERRPDLFEGVELIYDAEAIFARREMLKLSIPGVAKPTIDPDELLRSELGFARSADRVITVSPIEREEFLKGGVSQADVLAHAVDITPTETPFRGRQDFLFVGRMEEDDSPNVDSIVWFVNEVLPLVDAALGAAPRVFLAGRARAPRIKELESTRVVLLGEVEDIRPWYDSCRIFVAPTRFSAGIPLKVCEAGAAGIPVVATDLVFEQLGWNGKRPFRSGSTAEEFAKACVEVYTKESLWKSIREAELELVEKAFSRPVFNRQLGSIFASRPDETGPDLGKFVLPSEYVE